MDIKEKVNQYGKLKEQESALKKDVDKLNKEIKTYMGENELDTLEADDFVASYTLRRKEDFNEDKLIDLFKEELKDYAYEMGIIKTKEYIDMDAVEKAAYNGNIDEELLGKMGGCKTVKHTPTLTIKSKGGK